MELIRSEFYCFGIRIQKIVFHCLYKSKANYLRINRLNIKKTTGAKKLLNYLSVVVVSLILLL